MIRLAASILAGSLMLSHAVSAESGPAGAVGTWALVSYVSTASDGSKTENFGPTPRGIATFDRKGNFTITIVRSDLPKFAKNNREQGTSEENGAVVRGSIAYFGTYSPDPNGKDFSFKIDGATLPNWVGTSQKRIVTLPTKDELTLVNPVASGGGSAEVKWKRID